LFTRTAAKILAWRAVLQCVAVVFGDSARSDCPSDCTWQQPHPGFDVDDVVRRYTGKTTACCNYSLAAIRCALFGAIPLLLILKRLARIRFEFKATGWVVVRSDSLVLTWLAFYVLMPVLTLSVAAVTAYTNPIITLLLLDLCYSLAMVLTRSKCQSKEPLTLGLCLHIVFVLAGLLGLLVLSTLSLGAETEVILPFLLGGWVSLGPTVAALMVLLGVMSGVYSMAVARAYQVTVPSVIAIFDYA
jgi:hypothetical protein